MKWKKKWTQNVIMKKSRRANKKAKVMDVLKLNSDKAD